MPVSVTSPSYVKVAWLNTAAGGGMAVAVCVGVVLGPGVEPFSVYWITSLGRLEAAVVSEDLL
jgi:hypothetical protein